jgi:flavin reductase (DIM6/NTAB) family NADH-FMN oxidoreductase RutF
MPGSYRSDKSFDLALSANHGAFQAIDNGNQPTAESIRLLRREAAAAVTVVTVADARGFHGVTVSAFCLVSVTPPRLLFCLGVDSEILAAVRGAGHFSVCVLGDHQEFLADQFAGRAPAVNLRFTTVKHQLSRLGDPILEGCLIWFSGKVDGSSIQGDHAVVFGDIQEAGFGTGREPLLYFDGAYRFLQFE